MEVAQTVRALMVVHTYVNSAGSHTAQSTARNLLDGSHLSQTRCPKVEARVVAEEAAAGGLTFEMILCLAKLLAMTMLDPRLHT